MANRKITELTALAGANATDTDVFAIVDVSADETKKMTLGELKEAFDSGSGFVRITGDTMTGDLTVPNVVVSGNVDGRDVSADGTKLDGIEAGATADQTAAEIRSLVESATDSNVFTDADHSKLGGIEAGATADQTAAEIKTAYESNANTNEFSDAEQTKLAGIEASADVTDTANVTAAGALMDSELTDIAAVKALNQGVATTDDPTFTNTQLAEIAATISDTAVDVFVYDTSKDSDGGAWRKRTQGTSWYNETLNTATRGSRKEFPSVAVIVCRSDDSLAIYDGDDPDMPMWMVFNPTTGGFLDATDAESAQMLNGVLFMCGGSGGSHQINFISEENTFRASNTQYNKGSISNRNANNGWVLTASTGLVNFNPNDCAMTVLPNAPIDAATGLPVPTIAVATDGGTSVICDNGTVNDITHLTPHGTVTFFPNGDLFAHRQASTYYGYLVPASAYTAGDVTGASYIVAVTTTTDDAGTDRFRSPTRIEAAEKFSDTGIAFKGPSNIGSSHPYTAVAGLSLADWYDVDVHTKGGLALRSLITSDYQTGWMPKDTKLATLSDTDDADVTGSELVTNGTFDSDVSGWSAGASSTITYSSGVARLQLTGGIISDYPKARTSLGTLTAGKKYTVSIGSYISVSGNNLRVKLNTNGDVSSDGQPGGTLYYNSATSITNFSFTYEATSTEEHFLWMYLRDTVGDSEATFDNISVRLAEEDRSVNGNGLQVFGTVPKSAVASGADLVAYGSFSTNNYLEQPYNSDLDFGTGDFCVMLWVIVNSGFAATDYIFSRGTHLGYALNASGSNYTFYADGTGLSVTGLQTGVWQFICCGVRGGRSFISLNAGEEQLASAISTSVDEANATLIIGNYSAGSSAFFNGIVSLFRISATAPSPEQIAKIYEDEKVLFQENAQATLYGSSDAVTALAYDDSTELLHVGTSAGRSDFQGLRRVNNTTNAVGAAISASNGMIVEE